jgi:hypothetical protein
MFQKHRLHEKLTKYMLTSIISYFTVIFPQNNKLKIPPNKKKRMNWGYRTTRTRKLKKNNMTFSLRGHVRPLDFNARLQIQNNFWCDVSGFNVVVKNTTFRNVTPCSFGGRLPTSHRKLLPPSSRQKNTCTSQWNLIQILIEHKALGL